MLSIDRIGIFDLFSFQTARCEFGNGITSIVGVNKDQMGTLSNGAGKSSFMDAILFVLFGEVAKDIVIDDVVRKSEERLLNSGSAFLELSQGGNIYRITRGRTLKPAQSFLTIDENGVSVPFRRLVDGQAVILSILGVPPTYSASDFLKTNYFSKAALHSFASSSVKPAERMKIVSEALSLSKVALAIAKTNKESLQANSDLIATDASIAVLSPRIADEAQLRSSFHEAEILLSQTEQTLTDLLRVGASHASRRNLLVEARRLWINYRYDLNLNQSKMDSVGQSLAQLENERTNLDAMKKDIENRKTKLDECQIDLLQTMRQEMQNRQADFMDESSLLSVEMNELDRRDKENRNAIAGSVVCPNCGLVLRTKDGKVHAFDQEIVKADYEALVNDAEAFRCKVLEHNRQVAILAAARKAVDGHISDFEKQKAVVDQMQRQVDSVNFSSSFAELDRRYQFLRSEEERIESEFVNVFPSEFAGVDDIQFASLDIQFASLIHLVTEECNKSEFEIRELTRKESAAKFELSQISYKIAENEKTKLELAEYQNRRSLLVVKLSQFITIVELFAEFRRELIRQFLPIFEAGANQYLKEMGFDYLIRLELERLKADGEFKPELVVLVSDGISFRSFNTYSEGEKVRIGLACQFALMDIAGSRTINLVLLDEVLDSLDRIGFQSFLKVCKRLGSRVLVTSRLSVDEIGSGFDSLIQIVKENGVSSLA